jgi:hypothetical protein
MCSALPASQGCPSDPRSCARHTMWSNAAAGSACSPGARGTGKRRDFSTFTEGDAEDSDWAPLPGLLPCDYGSQCLAALGPGTFQPMLHCNMKCSRTGQRCSGRYHACCVTQQETQDSSCVLPPNACGLPKCVLVNKIGGPSLMPAPAVVISGCSARTGSYVDHQPKKAVQSMQDTTSRRARGSAAQPPPKGSAQYAAILSRAAVFALEINTNLASDKTIWSFGQIAAARKSLADRCQTSQFANVFKRTDDTFYSETQIWDILNEGVQSWQEASVNRNKTGDANEKLTGDDVILEQLAAAKQLVAAKASAMAEVRRQKTEYGASMSACQERHLQGAQRKDRCLTNLKQLVRIFSARESEVAHTFEQTHGRQPTTDQLLELVFEDREERELAMIKEWFANKQVSDRRAMRKCAASYGGIVVDSDGDSEAGSSGEASDGIRKKCWNCRQSKLRRRRRNPRSRWRNPSSKTCRRSWTWDIYRPTPSKNLCRPPPKRCLRICERARGEVMAHL